MRGGGLRLGCDAMQAGTSHYPLHRPTTTYWLCCKDIQFFSICKTCTYQLQKGVSKWVFHLWIQPFCIILVCIFRLQILRLRSGWHLNHANITNIPDPVHKNSPFHGRQAHFSVPIHKNGHFHGQKKTAQSCLIREEGAKLRQGCQINWNVVRLKYISG